MRSLQNNEGIFQPGNHIHADLALSGLNLVPSSGSQIEIKQTKKQKPVRRNFCVIVVLIYLFIYFNSNSVYTADSGIYPGHLVPPGIFLDGSYFV